VPALSSSFAPWDCKAKLTGPVFTGERHLSDGWAPIPDVCDIPIWGSRVEHRYQTRYYDHDYLTPRSRASQTPLGASRRPSQTPMRSVKDLLPEAFLGLPLTRSN